MWAAHALGTKDALERLLARTSCVIKQLNRSYQQQGGVLHRPAGERGNGARELEMSLDTRS